MANIVGGITTSHVPAIGAAIAKGLQTDPYWKPFFDGFPPVRDWLAQVRPDIAVVIYNDHGLNFFLDKMPTFAIGAAPEYRNADEGWGIPVVPPFKGDPALSWHLIESLVAEDFDLVTCQEMTVDHAFTLPMALLWPDQQWPVRTIPVVVNTVQAPLPSAARCYRLGQAIGRAIASWPRTNTSSCWAPAACPTNSTANAPASSTRNLICSSSTACRPTRAWATKFSTVELIERAGTQGVELLNWLVARGTLPESVRQRHVNYHIPISNTASGLLLLEPT